MGSLGRRITRARLGNPHHVSAPADDWPAFGLDGSRAIKLLARLQLRAPQRMHISRWPLPCPAAVQRFVSPLPSLKVRRAHGLRLGVRPWAVTGHVGCGERGGDIWQQWVGGLVLCLQHIRGETGVRKGGDRSKVIRIAAGQLNAVVSSERHGLGS